MEVLQSYIETNPKFLTKHHLDSFDKFVQYGIQKAILENEYPVRIMKKKDKTSDEFTHQVHLYFGGKRNTQNAQNAQNAQSTPLRFVYENPQQLPNICRLEGLNYDGMLKIDVDADIIVNDTLIAQETFSLDLVKIPTMLHSKPCLLSQLSKENLVTAGECPHEQGGYFIIGGLEKVIVSQELNKTNAIQTLYSRDEISPFAWKAYIKSNEAESAQIPQTTYLQFHEKEKTLWILIPYVKQLVPVSIVFRALGIESDLDILKIICGETYFDPKNSYHELIAAEMKASLSDGGYIYSQELALKYLASLTNKQPEKGKIKWKENILYILTRRLFPHTNHTKQSKLLYKAYYLGYMVKTLLLTRMGYLKPTDRDSLENREFKVSGELITEIFRDFYKDYIQDVRLRLSKRFEYQKEFRDNFGTILTHENSFPIFNSKKFQEQINKSFKGKWGKNPDKDENLGVIQDLQRLSFLGSISHLRRSNFFLPESAKLVEPRRLHTSQWGFICPIETPDGGKVSQLKHMSMLTQISSECTMSEFYPILHTLGVTPLAQAEISYKYHKFFVNGHWDGMVQDPKECVTLLRKLRQHGLLHYSISITWKINLKEIHVLSSGGRLLRPLFIANKTTEKIIGNNYKNFEWNSSTNLYSIQTFDKILAKKSKNQIEKILGEKTQTLIEYVDARECDTLLIALDPKKQETNYTTHFEINPKFILGLSALTLPFLEHNPSPRNLFAVGQSKQAVSVYTSNFQNRMDQTSSILQYPQKALVHTGVLEMVHQNKLSYGFNTIVAIGTFTGYNQEDSIIVNKTSVKRGMFQSTYVKTHLLREETVGQVLEICNPYKTHRNILNLKTGFDYSHLDENGIIRPNTLIQPNTILIGGCVMNEKGEWVDQSIASHGAHEYEFVKKVYLSPYEPQKNSPLGHAIRVAKVSTAEIRIPQIGDKFATRSAQKGTIGLLVDSWDMPYTEEGIVPDVIINPHAFPSRMTMGYFLEMTSGLLGLQTGSLIEAPAFHSCAALGEEIFEKLKQTSRNTQFHKKNANENGEFVMYSGDTGILNIERMSLGPMFYQRLKQMVTDKIHARGGIGPYDMLTKQPLHGRAKNGGFRMGEMERDVLLSHGISQFTRETFMERSDAFKMDIDCETGEVALPNARKTKTVQVPFAYKLLHQEARTLGVKMKHE